MITTELPEPKDYRYVIVTAMKDEGPYILDWISYHIAIGFTHFVILTNDCSDKTDNICRNLEKMGIVTHMNNSPPYPRGIQKTAWKRAERLEAVKKADWLMPLDVDEYLYLEQGDGSLSELMAQFKKPPTAISFLWRYFGDNNVIEIKDKPVWAQFTRAAHPLQAKPYQIRGFKTLYQNLEGSELGTHRPKFSTLPKEAQWINADGVPIDFLFRKPYWCVWDDGTGFGATLGRVYHYSIRSRHAFFLKMLRGFVNRTGKGPRADDSPMSYWNMFNWNISEDKTMLERGQIAEPIRNRLFDNIKISKLHEKALEYHQSQIAIALQKAEYQDDINQILTSELRNELDPDDPILSANSNINPVFSPSHLQNLAKSTILVNANAQDYYQKFTIIDY